jgi:hypothetical protein
MKRALLIGVDSYDSFPSLGGCTNDVHALVPLLTRNEDDSPNFQCQTLVTAATEPTTDAVREAVARLLATGADVSLLYFAGHGDSRPNDVVLVCADGTQTSPGVALSEILGQVQGSPISEVIVILDCCFSGGAGGVPQLGTSAAAIRPGVSILTASRGDQAAAELAGRGMFSTYLCGGLEGGAADVLGHVNVAGLYAYLSESFGAWDQRPTFKTNVERLNEIRSCTPAVPLNELRQLRSLFPTGDYEFPLDPSYEPSEEPSHPEHEGTFAILQNCRAAKLVEPVGARHMYFAAMESRACRLTPLGQLYRQMAEEDRL